MRGPELGPHGVHVQREVNQEAVTIRGDYVPLGLRITSLEDSDLPFQPRGIGRCEKLEAFADGDSVCLGKNFTCLVQAGGGRNVL